MGARDDLLAIPDATLRQGQVGGAALVHMAFKDNPQRWWTGFGDLDAGGYRWKGLGDLINISPIETAYDLSAQPVTFTLAATPELMAKALNAKDQVRDRQVTVSLQLFAVEAHAAFTPGGQEIQRGQPLGSPLTMFVGTMQRMPWSATGPTQRTLQLEAEGLFYRRNAPPRGRWTDADQKARWPGDRGLERLPLYAANYEPRWN